MGAADPEPLERLFPLSQRRTNHVYVAPEQVVLPALESVPNNAFLINDDLQLQDFLEGCRKRDRVTRRSAVRRLCEELLGAATIDAGLVKVDLAKTSLQNRISPVGLSDVVFLVVREDSLRDVRVAELLELFCRTPPLKQPRIVFIPNPTSGLASRLRYATPDIDVVGWEDEPVMIDRSQPPNVDDFTHLFDSRCFDAAAATTALQIKDWASGSQGLWEAALLITRTRSLLLSSERQLVEPEVNQLLARLEQIIREADPSEIELLMHARVAALLQKVYCAEDPKYLAEAIAIASGLSDELALASCLRFAEFLDLEPAVTDHMYRRAEAAFVKYGVADAAAYCENNRLVSRFVVALPEPGEFATLLETVDAQAPSLHRRHDILYNLGVCHLLAGRPYEAHAVFSGPEMLDARPLVRMSAELGILVSRRLSGDQIDHAEIEAFVQNVVTHVPPSNRWHIASLLLNAANLVHSLRDRRDLVIRYRIADLAPLGDDVRDAFQENRLLAARLGIGTAPDTLQIPGPFGAFFNLHRLAMPYYFIWS